MSIDFNRYAREGEKFLEQYAKAIGSRDDMKKTARIFRATLHAIRGFLTLEENLQLLSQLPVFLKGIYVENWTLKKKRGGKRDRDLLFQVRKADARAAVVDFEDGAAVAHAVEAMFRMLSKYVSAGELEDIRAILPQKYKVLVHP